MAKGAILARAIANTTTPIDAPENIDLVPDTSAQQTEPANTKQEGGKVKINNLNKQREADVTIMRVASYDHAGYAELPTLGIRGEIS